MKFRKRLLRYRLFQKIKEKKDRFSKPYWALSSPELLNTSDNIKVDWKNLIVRPKVGLVKDYEHYAYTPVRAYWPFFKRFLDFNEIPYEFLKINDSNWLEEAKKFDIILYHCESDPASLQNAKSKIYMLGKHFKKMCFPDYNEIWFYEDKIRQNYLLKYYNLSVIDTFVSNNKKEAFEFAEKTEYPIVSKISTGSSSMGVELIRKKKDAIKFINHVFADGRKTYWVDMVQKDYVYFQKYLKDAEYDLRIIIIGNKYFGYYRMRPANDFRASGAGLVVIKELPQEALHIARCVKEKLSSTFLAVDMLKSESKYLINEISVFIGIDADEQLYVNGKPVHYEYYNGEFVLIGGKYWFQELVLNEVIKKWIEKNYTKDNLPTESCHIN